MKSIYSKLILFIVLCMPLISVGAINENASKFTQNYKLTGSIGAIIEGVGTIIENPDNLTGETDNTTEDKSNINNGNLTSKVSCGNIDGIPEKIPALTSDIVTIVQFIVPVILIIMGSIDLFKGVVAQKDDDIKKGQQMLIKRLIVAAIIFFVVVIVKFVVSIIADTNTTNIIECIDCFISNDCK